MLPTERQSKAFEKVHAVAVAIVNAANAGKWQTKEQILQAADVKVTTGYAYLKAGTRDGILQVKYPKAGGSRTYMLAKHMDVDPGDCVAINEVADLLIQSRRNYETQCRAERSKRDAEARERAAVVEEMRRRRDAERRAQEALSRDVDEAWEEAINGTHADTISMLAQRAADQAAADKAAADKAAAPMALPDGVLIMVNGTAVPLATALDVHKELSVSLAPWLPRA